jgi:hypothetical protein
MVQEFQLDKCQSLNFNAIQDDQTTQIIPTKTVNFTTMEVLDAEVLVSAANSQKY